MNVWVTGGKGMLGMTLCHLLEAEKIPYVSTGSEVDITNIEDLHIFISKHPEVTHIMNCAAYTQVDLAEKEISAAYAINVHGPLNLGTIANEYHLHMIHFSSDYVFDGKGKTPYQENSPCQPLNVYAQTKRAGEIMLFDEHPQACIIRTSWLFGLYGKNFVTTMLNLMKERDTVHVVFDQKGRPTFCDDLCRAAIALGLADSSGIFHFANEGAVSWYAFALGIAEEAKRLHIPLKVSAIEPIPSVKYPTPAKRPAYSVLNTSKIESVLQYRPRKWKEALSDYLQQLIIFKR